MICYNNKCNVGWLQVWLEKFPVVCPSFHSTETSVKAWSFGSAPHSPKIAALTLKITAYTQLEARQTGRPLLESSYQTAGYVSWPELHYKSGTKHTAGKGRRLELTLMSQIQHFLHGVGEGTTFHEHMTPWYLNKISVR